MKRREFSLAAGAAIAAPLAAWGQQKPAEEGRDYRTLERRVPVETPPGKIEVIDFFWYSCPHCNAFEPTLQAWSKRLPDDVVLRRVPAAFRDDMVPQQRLFYALEAMGKVADLHVKIFDAIHKEKVDLTLLGPMADWVAKQGIDAAKFTELYNSFAISAKARHATDVCNAFEIEGVPSFGVAGRWYTSPSMAGTNGRCLFVTDSLIAEARKR